MSVAFILDVGDNSIIKVLDSPQKILQIDALTNDIIYVTCDRVVGHIDGCYAEAFIEYDGDKWEITSKLINCFTYGCKNRPYEMAFVCNGTTEIYELESSSKWDNEFYIDNGELFYYYSSEYVKIALPAGSRIISANGMFLIDYVCLEKDKKTYIHKIVHGDPPTVDEKIWMSGYEIFAYRKLVKISEPIFCGILKKYAFVDVCVIFGH